MKSLKFALKAAFYVTIALACAFSIWALVFRAICLEHELPSNQPQGNYYS